VNSHEILSVVRERALPSAADYSGLSRSWKADLVAGLTVGVVALPLALAFGVTSGVGAAAGLITAIVAGLVAAVFGGSNLQVSGPTGAMAVVLVPIMSRYGAEAVIPVAIMAGGLVMAMGLFGLGRAVTFIPWPVVEGFTIGIATIIFLQQVPLALDMPKPEGESTAIVALTAPSPARGPWSSTARIDRRTTSVRWSRRPPSVSLLLPLVQVAAATLGAARARSSWPSLQSLRSSPVDRGPRGPVRRSDRPRRLGAGPPRARREP